MTDREERDRVLQIARLYYENDQTQQEIAQRLQISCSTVSRMLKRGRDLGIVHISVHDPYATHTQLEKALVERFGLRAAVVAAQTDGLPDELLRKRIGQAAAGYLEGILRDGDVVGMGWGRTLFEMVEALKDIDTKARIEVTPLLGGLGQIEPSFQVNELARRLSDSFGGSWCPCFSPAILPDRTVGESLKGTNDLKQIIDRWDDLDIALIGVGNSAFDSDFEVLFAKYLEPSMKERLRASRVAGDICMRFFTAEGDPSAGWTEEIMGITLEQIRCTPMAIGVAGGTKKSEAILGAIRGGYLKILITDEVVAKILLEAKET